MAEQRGRGARSCGYLPSQDHRAPAGGRYGWVAPRQQGQGSAGRLSDAAEVLLLDSPPDVSNLILNSNVELTLDSLTKYRVSAFADLDRDTRGSTAQNIRYRSHILADLTIRQIAGQLKAGY